MHRTKDGSVGLFSPEADDIYHARSGALTEARQKFAAHVVPADNLKLLDICYGIGYNTKAFLERTSGCKNIHIDAIDTDKNLAQLSPFFAADKMVNMILYHLLQPGRDTAPLLKDYAPFLDKYMVNLCLNAFLHNIYYRHISKSYKNAMKRLKNNNITMSLYVDDARKAVQTLDGPYDYVFLDAFTPSKCPCLWSLDFFRLLYDRMADNGMLLTYSVAAPVRNSLLHAGFYVGKTGVNGKSGTIAAKNPGLIKMPLSEYDLGLLKTRAGVMYRDENLTLQNEAIIAAHETERENSDLMSTSRYIKTSRGSRL